jgi:ribonuclease HI
MIDLAALAVANIRPVVLTATVDASYQLDGRVTGIGIVLQVTDWSGRRGPIIAEIAERHADVAPGSIELFAVSRALEIARERGFRRVKVRSDCNALRRRLKRDQSAGSRSDASSRHGRTLALARWFDAVTRAYVPRRKNRIAHRLARAAVGKSA